MTRYACLLRAVNVSGQRKVTMSELRALCASLGYADVETYLQSGNVIVTTREARAKVGARISAAVGRAFGHQDVDVLVFSADELSALIAANPFVARGCDPAKLHVTFFASDPGPAAVQALDTQRYLPDEVAPAPSAVYLHCPNGYGRTKLDNAFFERKLGVRATTRNWQTVNNLRDLAREKKPA